MNGTNVDLDVLIQAKADIDSKIIPGLNSNLNQLETRLKKIAENITGYDLNEVVNFFNSNIEEVIGHITEGMSELSSYLANKIAEMQQIVNEASAGANDSLDLLNSLDIEN